MDADRHVNLEIVLAAPANNSFSGVYPHDRGYSSILDEQIAVWLKEAMGESGGMYQTIGSVRYSGCSGSATLYLKMRS